MLKEAIEKNKQLFANLPENKRESLSK